MIKLIMDQWLNDCKKDKLIGGKNFHSNIKKAHAMYNIYATPELRDLLEQTGLGNHPGMVKLFFNLYPKNPVKFKTKRRARRSK